MTTVKGKKDRKRGAETKVRRKEKVNGKGRERGGGLKFKNIGRKINTQTTDTHIHTLTHVDERFAITLITIFSIVEFLFLFLFF